LKVVKSKWPNPDLNPDLTTGWKLSNLSGQIQIWIQIWQLV